MICLGLQVRDLKNNKGIKMNLLNELLNLLEKDTPGLALGAFKLDVDKGKILTIISGKSYEFTPNEKNVAELFNSVTGVAKHSPGKALIYLKQHAKGVPVSEAIEEITEDIADQTSYNNLAKFETAVAKHAVAKKLKSWSTTIVSGHHVLHIRNKYFAVWDPEKKKGIIDPDFKGNSFELIDQLEKE